MKLSSLTLFLSFFFLLGCTSIEKLPPTPVTGPSLNPNGDSELAILMRNMEADWQQAKLRLIAKKPLKKIPNHQNLMTAEPTDDNTKKEHYDGLAKVYLASVDAFLNQENIDQVAAYNNVINSCVTCHMNTCMGPIPRIKKLLIK